MQDMMKETKAKIISNSKDAKYATKLVNEMLRLKETLDDMNKELVVPTSEVKETIDTGACKLQRTTRGILFTAKGGLDIFVSRRMAKVYTMLESIFEMNSNPPEDKELAEAFKTAVETVCQALIFCSLDSRMLFSTATHLLHEFKEYAEDIFKQSDYKGESEEDIEETNAFEKLAEGIDTLTKLPTPNIDDE